MTDPTPVELIPAEMWERLDALYAGIEPSQRGPVSDIADISDPYRVGRIIRRLLDLEADLRHTWAQRDQLRGHILDIDAHATPYGDIPDDPGWTGTYLLTAGALHRALGKIGHSAPSCQAEAELADVHRHVADLDTQLAATQAEVDRLQAYITEIVQLSPGHVNLLAAVDVLDAQPDTETNHG
jgi:hypothetical protein